MRRGMAGRAGSTGPLGGFRAARSRKLGHVIDNTAQIADTHNLSRPMMPFGTDQGWRATWSEAFSCLHRQAQCSAAWCSSFLLRTRGPQISVQVPVPGRSLALTDYSTNHSQRSGGRRCLFWRSRSRQSTTTQPLGPSSEDW